MKHSRAMPSRWLPGLRIGLLCALVALSGEAQAEDWGPASAVLYRGDSVVSFRALLEEGRVIVEAEHESGWHTYALDNTERARSRSGVQTPETEMPLSIVAGGALRVTGQWLQPPPADLSQVEIRWFTWGFEGTALFAAEAELSDAGVAYLTINGQACTDEVCARIDDLFVELPSGASLDSGSTIVLDHLVIVGSTD